jgi:hypothetical protein
MCEAHFITRKRQSDSRDRFIYLCWMAPLHGNTSSVYPHALDRVLSNAVS